MSSGALFAGALFAGALFAGALFAGAQMMVSEEPIIGGWGLRPTQYMINDDEEAIVALMAMELYG